MSGGGGSVLTSGRSSHGLRDGAAPPMPSRNVLMPTTIKEVDGCSQGVGAASFI